jgi:general secretion pathway protein I
MKFKPTSCRTRAGERRRAGFTLVEVLAALLFMAIVIPVAVEGVHLAGRAGVVAERKAAAALVADSVLNEAIAASQAGQGGPNSQNGTTEVEGIDYQWQLRNELWGRDAVRLISIQVTFAVQGKLEHLVRRFNPRRDHHDHGLRGQRLAMIPSRKTCSPRNAFTLLEVMIAVIAFAIVLAAINSVFYGALRLRNKTTEAIDRALPIQQAVAIIKRDLAGIVPPGGTLAGTFQSGSADSSLGLNSGASANTTGGMLGNMAQAGIPAIYTDTGIVDDNAPWGEVQKVTYYLRDPTNQVASNGKDLIRAVTRNLLAPIEDEPLEQWLLGNVESIQFEYYTGTEWLDTWDSASSQTTSSQTASSQSADSTSQSTLPKAIKVLIQLATDDSNGRPLSRTGLRPPIEFVVPVMVQARTNDTQSAQTTQTTP